MPWPFRKRSLFTAGGGANRGGAKILVQANGGGGKILVQAFCEGGGIFSARDFKNLHRPTPCRK